MTMIINVHIHVVITGQQINKHLNLHDVLAIYKSNWIPVALSNPLLLACKQYALLLFSLDDVRLGRDIFRWTNIFNVCKIHWPQCILVKLCQGFVIIIYCTVPLLYGNQSAQNRWCQFHNITTTDLHKYNIIINMTANFAFVFVELTEHSHKTTMGDPNLTSDILKKKILDAFVLNTETAKYLSK